MQRRTHHKKDLNRYWVYGTHAVYSVLQNPKRQIHQVLASAGHYEAVLPLYSKVKQANSAEMQAAVGKQAVHQGLACLVSPLPTASLMQLKTYQRIIICDQITDPHNIGAIARSALGLGFDAMLLQTRHAPAENATILKTSSGAWEHLPVCYVTNLTRAIAQLKEAGFWSVGLDGYADKALTEMQDQPEQLLLAVGSEGEGLRHSTRNACDYTVKLPMHSALESYNASVSAALAMYHFSLLA